MIAMIARLCMVGCHNPVMSGMPVMDVMNGVDLMPGMPTKHRLGDDLCFIR